jgi:GT2 family glycosyltransferase
MDRRELSQLLNDSEGKLRVEMCKISVIVLNWNGLQFLEACLFSLRKQTFCEFETILVDNGSTDGSVPYVRSAFPEVRLVELSKNAGFAGGNNAGYEAAFGEWIVLLNNDTEAEPNWLEEIWKAAQENPGAGAIASKMLYFNERNRIDNCGFSVTRAGTTVDLGRGDLDGAEWSRPRKVFGPCGGAAAYRRETLRNIGFLDQELFIIFEDVDLAFRMQLRGYSCVLAPGAVVYHRYRQTLGKHPAGPVYFSQRNIELVYFKNMPAALMAQYLPARFVYEAGAAIYFFRLGTGMAFMKAKLAALWHLPSILRKRRGIQKGRALSNGQLRALLADTRQNAKWKKFWAPRVTETEKALKERPSTG